MAPEKSVLIPTAHDEDALNRCNYFKAQFNAPKAFIYLTEEEKNFVQSKFKNHRIPSTVIGAPINIDHREFMNDIDICRQFGIKDRYILYIGRIDQTKNCEDLIECFQYYKKMHPGNLKLVMAGNVYMELPEGEDFLPIGFVDESAKKALLQQASALVLASKYESLSLVTLESMAAGVPVLLRGQSIVLKAHTEKSNAGLYFYEKYDFEQALHFILTNKNLAKGMAQNGKKYVYDNYRYTIIKQKLVNFIESL
jgi:glycosyltransferase involved in cell wall biosynthesis